MPAAFYLFSTHNIYQSHPVFIVGINLSGYLIINTENRSINTTQPFFKENQDARLNKSVDKIQNEARSA